MATPKCCNKDAKLIAPSRNLEYWYCEICKKEVTEAVPFIEDLPAGEFQLDSYGHIIGAAGKSGDNQDIFQIIDDLLKKSTTNLENETEKLFDTYKFKIIAGPKNIDPMKDQNHIYRNYQKIFYILSDVAQDIRKVKNNLQFILELIKDEKNK